MGKDNRGIKAGDAFARIFNKDGDGICDVSLSPIPINEVAQPAGDRVVLTFEDGKFVLRLPE